MADSNTYFSCLELKGTDNLVGVSGLSLTLETLWNDASPAKPVSEGNVQFKPQLESGFIMHLTSFID
jgi:hypothetical protein